MSEAEAEWADRLVRWTTTVSVAVLAVIAAIISYKHMFALVHRYGETSWTAALLPVSVDGMIVASSMTLLADSRSGRRSGLLPWILLVIGSAASLAANVAVAEPSAVGRVIAAWPSCALVGSYELLMRQVRNSTRRRATAASDTSQTSPMAVNTASYVPSYEMAENSANSYAAHTPTERRDRPLEGSKATGSEDFIPRVDNDQPEGAQRVAPPPPHRRPVSGLQRQAWQWALANRTPAGDLPSGKAIAQEFGRRERWGRLVKQAGRTGRLEPAAIAKELHNAFAEA